MQWEPISTAPRDGAVILLFRKREVTAGLWVGDQDEYPWQVVDADVADGWNGWRDDVGGPTHWMPLPPPPAQ